MIRAHQIPRIVRVAVAAITICIGPRAAAADVPVTVPVECIAYWSTPGSPAGTDNWNAVLSFAGCIQDNRVLRVERREQLPGLIVQLHEGLAPSLQFYVMALQLAPPPIQLRAAYAVGLAHVAMLTRARASLADPRLGDELERLLDRDARLAHRVFSTIVEISTGNPELAQDPMGRYIVRSSARFAAQLAKRWPTVELPSNIAREP